MSEKQNGTKEMIARKLKEYREATGLTVYDVGDKIGKSGKTVSAWENGRGTPDADTLLELCKIFGIESVSEFYGQPAVAATERQLTADEEHILRLYRNATVEGQQAAAVLLEGFAKKAEKQISAG